MGHRARTGRLSATTTEPLPWRTAGLGDAVALRDLERRANLAGFGHVFGAEPFPDDEVLARWRATLVEPGVVTEVLDGENRPVALLCHEEGLLRHLSVDPAAWGLGIGSAALARFAATHGAGSTLWCLERNARALALYARHGWTPTGRTRRTPFPPWPTEVELALRSADAR
ncbi:GNAT family N-acetyltransferase [Nocardioides sp. CFH 31398]|uniref:GNAT family N-acetyltransferase n=1 Tax=Nocardioides sp. CFH 31398 TaxID=2919579 RepID=UPI001F05A3EC|nr:GNAT family N-acetyltransferase [Nocardioides sp. CFH 31398]MCH1868239.1 GNAT family N-acetyltransferase [Nocardioides sp. CFH 31398]